MGDADIRPPGPLVSVLGPVAAGRAEDAMTPVAQQLLRVLLATGLLAARLGPERIARELPATARLVRRCAGLPLALAIVAGRAADWPGLPLAALAGGLEAEPARLDALDGDDQQTSVRSVFSWSLRHLSAPAAEMFALLGVHCGPDISLPAAASLAAAPVPAARAALAELAAASLVTEHRPGRYLLHDLLRAYATERAAADRGPGWCRAALTRSFDHYLHTLIAYAGFHPLKFAAGPAAPGVTPERLAGDAALTAWLKGEYLVLSQAVGQAAEADYPAAAWRLFAVFAQSVCRHGQWHNWEQAGQTALASARADGDDGGTGWTRLWFAVICFHLGDLSRCRAEFTLAVAAFERSGDLHGQAVARTYLADALTVRERTFGERLRPRADAERPRRASEGIAHAEAALALFRQAGEPDDAIMALGVLVDHYALGGDTERASRYAEQAVALGGQVTAPEMRAQTHAMVGYVHQARGELQAAVAAFGAALAMLPGDPSAWTWQRAEYLAEIAETYQARGDLPSARAAWTAALELLNRADHPMAAHVRAKLGFLAEPAAGGRPGD